MKRAALTVLLLVLVPIAPAADPPALTVSTAQGTVEKIDKDSLSVQPRRPDGKFDKVVVVKLTGTSKIALLSTRETAGKTVAVQRDIEARDLRTGQKATLVYTTIKDENILLTAVVLPLAEK